MGVLKPLRIRNKVSVKILSPQKTRKVRLCRLHSAEARHYSPKHIVCSGSSHYLAVEVALEVAFDGLLHDVFWTVEFVVEVFSDFRYLFSWQAGSSKMGFMVLYSLPFLRHFPPITLHNSRSSVPGKGVAWQSQTSSGSTLRTKSRLSCKVSLVSPG